MTAAFHRNVTNYTTVSFDSVQVLLINHSFKKDSVTFDVKMFSNAVRLFYPHCSRDRRASLLVISSKVCYYRGVRYFRGFNMQVKN